MNREPIIISNVLDEETLSEVKKDVDFFCKNIAITNWNVERGRLQTSDLFTLTTLHHKLLPLMKEKLNNHNLKMKKKNINQKKIY